MSAQRPAAGVKRVFAVDFGASGGKCFAGIFDKRGFNMVEVHRFDHEIVSFHVADRAGRLSERAQWDQPLLQRQIVLGLQSYRRNVADRLDAIGIDTWGADYQLMSADGEPLAGAYAYRDHRLDGMIDEVKRRISAERIYEITGIHFLPFNLSNQLLWLVEHRRDLLLPGAFCLPTPSIYQFFLCGARQVDSTWASITQLMDAATQDWSDEILRALGIERRLLPPIVKPGTALGALHEPIARAADLNAARVIAVGTHDTASAFAAAPIHNAGEALIISSGTWSLVGKLIPSPITTPAAMKFNMGNEGGIGNVRFLRNCMGTWLVQELRRVWRAADGKEPGWSELDRLTRSAPAFSAFVDPDDARFFNPANMEQAIVSFCKETRQKPPRDRGAFVRVVYESLALKYRHVQEAISRISGLPTKVVHIVGGGSKNKLLNQFTADATGLPVVAGPVDATAVGNIMVQALSLGLIRSPAEALPIIRAAFPIQDYKPRDVAAWNKAYARFQPLVTN